MLFTDVVNCMQTENLELKKLVYLYLINYAKSQPDLAILAVNTFVKVWRGVQLDRLERSALLVVIREKQLCACDQAVDHTRETVCVLVGHLRPICC